MTTRDIQSTVATSQHTVNYDLPLWNGTDITSWQGNLNDAFNKIDTAMFENKTAMLGYKEIADKLEETNGSTVELVEQVNQQLTEINAKYDEVKQGLTAANQQIAEANQAILDLQQEDETVKMQLDTMQDDIGKLMQWHVGELIDLSDIEGATDPQATTNKGTIAVINARYVGSILNITFRYVKPEADTNSDILRFSNSVLGAIKNKVSGGRDVAMLPIVAYGTTVSGSIQLCQINDDGILMVQAGTIDSLEGGIYTAKAIVAFK